MELLELYVVITSLYYYALIVMQNARGIAAGEPWDLDGPCQPYIKKFAEVSSRMIHCAATYSSPPKVCTYCTEEYVALKHVEYELHKLKDIFSRDNTSCNRVIFENYVISYVSEVSNTITRNIWTQSRCSSCVIINWQFDTNSTDYSYHNNTVQFQNKLYDWRRCVSNYSSLLRTNNRTVICVECMNSFNALFAFYWDIYVTPHIDFCLDVETTMNDTMNLWHNVWHCPDDRVEDHRDWTLLGYSFAFLTIITALFYFGSYVQSEGTERQLVQYSQLEAPHGLRSRLLSSSTLYADSRPEVAHGLQTHLIPAAADCPSTSTAPLSVTRSAVTEH